MAWFPWIFSQRLAQRPSCTHWFTRLTRRQQLGKSPKMAIEMAIQEATDFRRPSRLILGNYPGIFLEKNEGFEQLHVELINQQALERFGKIRTGTCCLPSSARFGSACPVQSLHLFWSSHFRLRCAGYLQCCSQYPCGGKSCILKCSTCRWFFSSSPYSWQKKKLQILNSKNCLPGFKIYRHTCSYMLFKVVQRSLLWKFPLRLAMYQPAYGAPRLRDPGHGRVTTLNGWC